MSIQAVCVDRVVFGLPGKGLSAYKGAKTEFVVVAQQMPGCTHLV